MLSRRQKYGCVDIWMCGGVEAPSLVQSGPGLVARVGGGAEGMPATIPGKGLARAAVATPSTATSQTPSHIPRRPHLRRGPGQGRSRGAHAAAAARRVPRGAGGFGARRRPAVGAGRLVAAVCRCGGRGAGGAGLSSTPDSHLHAGWRTWCWRRSAET
eukprot:355212-Chlamydomonas_euryale.AAC.4